MTTTDCASDGVLNDNQIEPAEGSNEKASRPLKGLFFGFAATMTVGLALTSWYLGVRIVAADEGSQSMTQNATPVAVKPAANDVVPAPVAHPIELYLQIAGLGPKQDASFVRSLESRGFHATVQPAGILVGPFATRVDLEQAQLKLQARGVLAVETTR